MIRLRKSAERGHFDLGWLDTRHTFSFGDYHDPAHMGFRTLRVINEDRIQAGQGFGSHPHRDMEIVTVMLEGELTHRDSMGNGSIIREGEVQRMSAGRGVVHSEHNHSGRLVHLLQIWILPERRGLDPSYEQRAFPVEERRGRLQLLASGSPREGSLRIHQDVDLYASSLMPGKEVTHTLAADRHAWVQVTRGRLALNGEGLGAGDGAAVSGEPRLVIAAESEADLILFDLA